MRDKIKIGDKSLDFALPDQDGKIFSFQNHLEEFYSRFIL